MLFIQGNKEIYFSVELILKADLCNAVYGDGYHALQGYSVQSCGSQPQLSQITPQSARHNCAFLPHCNDDCHYRGEISQSIIIFPPQIKLQMETAYSNGWVQLKWPLLPQETRHLCAYNNAGKNARTQVFKFLGQEHRKSKNYFYSRKNYS